MVQCTYPLCTHGKGKVKVQCRMHRLPADPAKCRIWMMRCRVAGTPRKLPAKIYVCSCHFTGSVGPTKQNPHPIPFQSPAGSMKPFIPKRFPSNVRDTDLNRFYEPPIQEQEHENSFEVDDPNGDLGHDESRALQDIQSPAGFVSNAAIRNSPHDLEQVAYCLFGKKNAVPIIINESTMKRKAAEGTEPEEGMSQVPNEDTPPHYNPFLKIGEKLERAMKASFCSDCSSTFTKNKASFESLLAEPLRSFEAASKSEALEYRVNKRGTKDAANEAGGPKVRDQNVGCDLPFLSFDKMTTSPNWSEEDFKYFTGISRHSFEVLYKFLGGYDVCSQLKYYVNRNTPSRECGALHSPKSCLVMTLVRLRRGYPERDMGKMFGLSDSSISNIVTAWVKFMSLKFKTLEQAMFVPVQVQEKNKPACFKPFPNLRCVVDATEIKIQKPKNFEQQSNTYSSYKSTNTAKFVVASSCYGGLSYVSEGFEGNISDRQLFLKSGILDYINPGEAIMVDRGFDLEADLNKRDIDIIIPPFLGNRQAFTEREMFLQKAVATARIHVETLIGRIENFRLIRYVYPNTMLDVLSDVMRVCSVLCNFNDPFVRWEEEEAEGL